jgi:hypothetical protein
MDIINLCIVPSVPKFPLVSGSSVAHPVAVRYVWAMNPSCNLYNRAGLPAAPFRTDDGDDMLYVR